MKIEFDGQKLTIPNSWKDLKLSDYEKIYMLRPQTRLDYVKYVASICNIDVDILLGAPTQLFDIVSDAVKFVLDNDYEPINKIVIDGEAYFISFADKLTLAEYVDIETIISGESEHKLSEVLAVLCRPATEKYNPDLFEERSKLFQNLSCDKVLPLVAFFLFKKKKYDEILNHYSTVMVQANQFLKDTEHFVRNGVGTRRLPIWQTIRYYHLMRSLKKELSKYSDFYSTSPTKPKLKKNNIISKNK